MMAIATDDFNRASLGANWTNALGAVVIDSNTRAVCSVAGENDAFYNALTFSADQYAQAVVTLSTADWVGVCVRASANNSYVFYGSTSDWEITRWVSGVAGVIASGSWTASTGDVLRLEVVGTTLRAFRNGVLVSIATDTSLSTGNPGVSFWGTNASFNAFADDWEGGDLYNELIDRDVRFARTNPVYRM
jgi:hypothetical protein